MWTPLRKAPRMENRLWEELRVWGRSHSLARSQTYSAELGDGSPPSRPQSYSDPPACPGLSLDTAPGVSSSDLQTGRMESGTPSRCSLLVRGRMPRYLATPCQDRAFGQAHPRSVLRPGCWAEDKDPTSFQIRLQTKKRVMEFTHLRVSHLCENRALPGLFPPSGRPDRSRQKSQASSLWIPNTPLNHPTDIYCTLCIPGTMESSGDLPMSKAALMPALPKAAVPQGDVYLGHTNAYIPTNHGTRSEGREKDQWTAAHSGSPRTDAHPVYPMGSFDGLPYIMTTQSRAHKNLATAGSPLPGAPPPGGLGQGTQLSGHREPSHLPMDVCALCQTGWLRHPRNTGCCGLFFPSFAFVFFLLTCGGGSIGSQNSHPTLN